MHVTCLCILKFASYNQAAVCQRAHFIHWPFATFGWRVIYHIVVGHFHLHSTLHVVCKHIKIISDGSYNGANDAEQQHCPHRSTFDLFNNKVNANQFEMVNSKCSTQ